MRPAGLVRSTAKRQEVNLDAERVELIDSLPHIHGVAAEPVELGDDENVALLQPIDQPGEARPLGGRDRPGDGFGDDTARLDLETGGADLAELVVGGLLDGRDASVSENP